MFDLVHDVEVIFPLPKLLTAPGNLFQNKCDACEIAICSFTGITHISEKKIKVLLAVNIGHV